MKITPTGTIIPTVDELSAGTNIKSMSISTTGAIAIFQFFETKTTPSAPKSAGRSWSNAGFNTGFLSKGVSGTISITPIMITNFVTIDETAIAIVDIISPSSLWAFTPAESSALSAHGSFRFDMFHVTKDR